MSDHTVPRAKPAKLDDLPRLVVGQPEVGVPLGPASAITLIIATLIGLVMVAWPLLIPVPAGATRQATDAPLAFALLLPMIIAVVLAQLSERGMDTRSLAMLGVLSALNAAIRPALSAGTAGIEAVFFLLVLAGRAYGAGFGFVLGCTSLLASALLTGGVGPYLPFQMMFAAWIGCGAGLLPRRVRGVGEIVMLVGYVAVAAYAFGALMNLWFWPFVTGSATPEGIAPGGLDYVPGAPLGDNLARFLTFTLLTSTLGWDTGRAVANGLFIAVLGAPVLAVLRRATRGG